MTFFEADDLTASHNLPGVWPMGVVLSFNLNGPRAGGLAHYVETEAT